MIRMLGLVLKALAASLAFTLLMARFGINGFEVAASFSGSFIIAFALLERRSRSSSGIQ